MNVNNVNIDSFNQHRYSLTEYFDNYKRISMPLLIAYNSLKNNLNRLSIAIMSSILQDKIYGTKNSFMQKNIDEEKRIYNYTEVTTDSLLMDMYSVKYNSTNCATLASDKSNIVRQIRKLDEKNIFHVWRLKDLYMFVLERELGSWKHYNLTACVTPYALKKIINVSDDMINTMYMLVKNKYHSVDTLQVDRSFGEFINVIIKKLHRSVSEKVSLWNDESDIHEYLHILASQLEAINDFEGLACDDDFIVKLPRSVSKSLQSKIRKDPTAMKKHKTEVEDIDQSELASDLIPKNPILAKKIRAKKIPSVHVDQNNNIQILSDPLNPTAQSFDDEISPFKDAREFVNYYRSCVTQFTSGRVKFNPYEVDCPEAAKLLDILASKGRQDKHFLTAWFRYFYDNKLKGEKAMKKKYTGLKQAGEILESFECKYLLHE